VCAGAVHVRACGRVRRCYACACVWPAWVDNRESRCATALCARSDAMLSSTPIFVERFTFIHCFVQVRSFLRGELRNLPAVYGRSGNADDGPRKMWAAEWHLIQQYAPADHGVHDDLNLIEPPANSLAEVADFPTDVIADVSRHLRDLQGYDPATRVRLAQERAERQLAFRRKQRRARRAAEQQRAIVALMVEQRRRERAPRASTIADLLRSDGDHTDPEEWLSGEGWPVEAGAGATEPIADGMVVGGGEGLDGAAEEGEADQPHPDGGIPDL